MREIKFKAYHKKRKEIYDVHSIVFNEYVFKVTDDGIGTAGNPDDWKDVILMQYTGLKDKNGKEIYEGDIITTDRYICIDDGKQNYVLIVEFEYFSFYAIAHCVNKNKAGISNGIGGILDEDESYEILGNIYQNPELLEGVWYIT